ncbi:iron-containing redox enzyme family protein [Variovorax boronicumulans]|uniref:iron-containing redox enzyme family protein n=1 Tax=Variovorax boronicumulans TaxID=436515 RepID=UPI0033972DC2
MALLAPLPQPDAKESESALASLQPWRAKRQLAFERATESDDQRRRVAETLVLQSSPLGLTLGCWLQGMSAPGVCEDEDQLTLLSLLADDVGVGHPYSARRSEFRRLMERFEHSLYGVSPTGLAQVRDIQESMFALPCALLAMSRRSDVFHLQLCAMDLVLRTVELLPAWAMLASRYPQCVDWRRLDLREVRDPKAASDALACSTKIAEHYRTRGGVTAKKFEAAVHWAVDSIKAWDLELHALCTLALDRNHAMATLLRRKSREASIYHKTKTLAGCPLSDHFKKAATDPLPLLDALAQSRYVRPGNSQTSSLVNGLISPRGPMFRVFPEQELAVIREWIDGLALTRTEADTSVDDRPRSPSAVRPPEPKAAATSATPLAARPIHVREAYFLLQGRALAPDTRAYAVDYVRRWLEAAARSLGCSDRSLPNSWTAEGLRPWLLDQHDLHGQAYEKSSRDVAPVSRDDVIESTLQLAPLILIDGAWLQGFTDVDLACSEVGQFLFETYWDELGNGRVELNHPKIYRDLLASMGMHLAPTGSWQFASDTRIKDDSFRLPVYWLCLGKLPLTFMPEVLGMNLAMELSGVGDGYRNARQFLIEHGFSTQFVDLHNTIDNVSTGHSAWAADAIDKYMATLLPYCDDDFFAAQWLRIRTGYASLSSVPGSNRSLSAWTRSVFRRRLPSPKAPARPLHHYAHSMDPN